MLPPLGTPFRARDLDANLERFLPIRPPPPLPVDVDEALCNGWLELWYQSKIDPQSLVPRGAEALIRVRHPTWGIVAPAYFIPAADDPYLHALSRFVIARALADSTQFAGANHPVRASIPLPLLALEDMQFIDGMMERLSEKTRQNGFLIAVDCIDLVNDYALVRRIGAQLAQRNIGITINDIDSEGAASRRQSRSAGRRNEGQSQAHPWMRRRPDKAGPLRGHHRNRAQRRRQIGRRRRGDPVRFPGCPRTRF